MDAKKIILMNDFRRPGNFPNDNLMMIKERLSDFKIHDIIGATQKLELDIFTWTLVQDKNFKLPVSIALKILNCDGVIGLELPRYIIYFLRKNYIPFINYHHSCYRCLGEEYWAIETHLPIDVKTSLPKIIRPFSNEYKIGTLLIGQTQYDRVLIDQNKFISLIDFEYKLKDFPHPIYFSPHPVGNDELHNWALKNNFIMTDKSTYELFDNRPELVCGVNSSALYEARDIWGLEVKFLAELPEAKKYIHLPFQTAFDHSLLNAVFENDDFFIINFLSN